MITSIKCHIAYAAPNHCAPLKHRINQFHYNYFLFIQSLSMWSWWLWRSSSILFHLSDLNTIYMLSATIYRSTSLFCLYWPILHVFAMANLCLLLLYTLEPLYCQEHHQDHHYQLFYGLLCFYWLYFQLGPTLQAMHCIYYSMETMEALQHHHNHQDHHHELFYALLRLYRLYIQSWPILHIIDVISTQSHSFHVDVSFITWSQAGHVWLVKIMWFN